MEPIIFNVWSLLTTTFSQGRDDQLWFYWILSQGMEVRLSKNDLQIVFATDSQPLPYKRRKLDDGESLLTMWLVG